METANVKRYRYFLYSKEQHKTRTDVDKTINKIFNPGKVLVNGQWKSFTEISIKPSNSYADTKIVTEGYLEDIKYKNPTSVWGAM